MFNCLVTGLTANERVKITREGRKKEKEGNSPLLDLWMRSEIRKNEAIASYFRYDFIFFIFNVGCAQKL